MTSPDKYTNPELAAPKLSLVAAAAAEAEAVADAVAAADAAADIVGAIDRLSLNQALLDVEIANARVLDLTARLVESNQRADGLRADLESVRSSATNVSVQANADVAAMRCEMAVHQAYLDEQRSSTAYRWAAKVWNLRNALRS